MTTIDEARAAVLYEAMLPPCEACKCVLADDPDRNECACGGSCCTDSEYIDTKIDAEARMYQVIERLIAAVREEVLCEVECVGAHPGGTMTPEPDTSASMTAVAYCERGYDEEMGEHSRHKMSKCPAIQQAIAADCRRYALAVLQDVDDGSAAEVKNAD